MDCWGYVKWSLWIRIGEGLAILNIINCQFGHVQGSAVLPVYIM